MRVALLSDVHGNLPALEAALATCRELGVDRYLSAGDAIGYGPHPSECIDRLREIDAVALAGNHEMYVLGRLPPSSFSERARRSLDWTASKLGPDRTDWLATLPESTSLGPIVMAHASLDGFNEYVIRPRQASRQLRLLAGLFPEARILVLGHTHQPLYHPEGQRSRTMQRGGTRGVAGPRTLVNPGSIGQSRQWERLPRARFALVDLEASEVRWFAVDYDREKVLRDLAAVGLPPDSIHVRPTARRAFVRAIRAHTDLSLPRALRNSRPSS